MATAGDVRALAYKGREQDLGAVAPEEVRSQPSPLPVNASFLPSEQPLCPRCLSGIYPLRQNQRGDTLFECLKCARDDGSYQAIYRMNPPKWEPHPQSTPEQVAAWRAPKRMKDVEDERAGKKPADPVVAPQGAWPEAQQVPAQPQESRSRSRRRAAQRGDAQ